VVISGQKSYGESGFKIFRKRLIHAQKAAIGTRIKSGNISFSSYSM
jgi:hypothetical protein